MDQQPEALLFAVYAGVFLVCVVGAGLALVVGRVMERRGWYWTDPYEDVWRLALLPLVGWLAVVAWYVHRGASG